MPVDDLCDYITWLDKQAPIPDIDRPHYLSRLRDLQQKQEQLQPAQSPAPD